MEAAVSLLYLIVIFLAVSVCILINQVSALKETVQLNERERNPDKFLEDLKHHTDIDAHGDELP